MPGRRKRLEKCLKRKSMKYVGTIILVLLIRFTGFSQDYPTRDSVHIFWQPNVKITFEDYLLSEPQEQIKNLMEEYDFSASASVGIWAILDVPEVPKKKKERYRQYEKVYFAPAFERTTSFAQTNDTLQTEIQNLFFDMCEFWTRWARRELDSLQAQMDNATGVKAMFYSTIKAEMNENRVRMFQHYFKEVIIDKKENGFIEWRNLIDRMLQKTESWKTKPEECYRLMVGKPIEKGYIQAITIMGDMRKKEKMK
jgi:hypothetical protein